MTPLASSATGVTSSTSSRMHQPLALSVSVYVLIVSDNLAASTYLHHVSWCRRAVTR